MNTKLPSTRIAELADEIAKSRLATQKENKAAWSAAQFLGMVSGESKTDEELEANTLKHIRVENSTLIVAICAYLDEEQSV